ncbi:MAG: hypothetical protein ACI39F_08975 [Acutalibacteraceae bacterium]
MKKICVSMRNRVFAESIMFMLERTGDFRPIRITATPPKTVIQEFQAAKPEILLLDVTPTSKETTCEGRIELIKLLKERQPDCKIAIFCDETAHPDQARAVVHAKQDGFIDAFFYASVTAEYLTASLDAI